MNVVVRADTIVTIFDIMASVDMDIDTERDTVLATAAPAPVAVPVAPAPVAVPAAVAPAVAAAAPAYMLPDVIRLVSAAPDNAVVKRRVLGMRNAMGYTVAHLLVLVGARNELETLLTFAEPAFLDIADKQGVTPLHLACRLGHDDVVSTLINAGADVHKTAEESVTPLHVAARSNCLPAVVLLLDAGAQVDVSNNYGWTPLHMACMNGALEVCELLLARGANIDARNAFQRTPLIIAAANARMRVVNMLLGRGAQEDVRDTHNMTYLDHIPRIVVPAQPPVPQEQVRV